MRVNDRRTTFIETISTLLSVSSALVVMFLFSFLFVDTLVVALANKVSDVDDSKSTYF